MKFGIQRLPGRGEVVVGRQEEASPQKRVLRGQRVPEAGDGHEVVQEAAAGEQIGGRVEAGRERVPGLIHQALLQQETDWVLGHTALRY